MDADKISSVAMSSTEDSKKGQGLLGIDGLLLQVYP